MVRAQADGSGDSRCGIGALLWGWLGVSGYHEMLGLRGCSLAWLARVSRCRCRLPDGPIRRLSRDSCLGLAASANIGTVLILFLAPVAGLL